MFTVNFYKIKNNNIQQMHLNTFITYIKYSYMFRPLMAILRELYTMKHQSNNNNNIWAS
jgi:arginine deiminase